MILFGYCCSNRSASVFFNLISFKESFSVIIQILQARENGIYFKKCMGWFDLKETYIF